MMLNSPQRKSHWEIRCLISDDQNSFLRVSSEQKIRLEHVIYTHLTTNLTARSQTIKDLFSETPSHKKKRGGESIPSRNTENNIPKFEVLSTMHQKVGKIILIKKKKQTHETWYGITCICFGSWDMKNRRLMSTER